VSSATNRDESTQLSSRAEIRRRNFLTGGRHVRRVSEEGLALPRVALSHRCLCTRLERGNLLEHVFDAARLRLVVARRVILRLTDVDHLDDAVVEVHGEALAPRVSELSHGSWVSELESERLGGFHARVRHERHFGVLNHHLLSPRGHDGAVVHAEDEHLVDPSLVKLLLSLDIAWDLARGSGWREGAGKTNEDHLASLNIFKHIFSSVGVEALEGVVQSAG